MILNRFFGWSRLSLVCTLFWVGMLFGAPLPVTATEDLSEAEKRLRSGDVSGALSLFNLAATNGNLVAQNRLGLLYFSGVSVAKKPELAFKKKQKSDAIYSLQSSATSLGTIYFQTALSTTSRPTQHAPSTPRVFIST